MFSRLTRACYRAWWLLQWRLLASATTEREIIEAFHRLYFERGKIDGTAWAGTRWRGRPVAQCPFDLMAISRLIQEQLPIAVLEIGTGWGGSALFYADNGAAPVVTIDHLSYHEPFDPGTGIVSIVGDSLATLSRAHVRHTLREQSALVILDGNHQQTIVYEECEAYAPYVRIGAHLIVCDTQFDGHPIPWERGPGAWDAVEQFLAVHPEFVQDRDVEPMLTFNPRGWLKRVR